ncbi:histidine phosphatase superfamily [Phlyctochytrium arcticum]|nr:histidine phosphatase superfamily [Phlyctochytrium arcticum]
MRGKNICLVVTVIRHAETDQNAQVPRVLQGQSGLSVLSRLCTKSFQLSFCITDNPINALGFKQVESLAWRLKKETFDHIYTSDLMRAKQTAHEVAKHQKAPLTKDHRLREQNLGDLTGLPWPQAKAILKEEDRSFDDHVADKGEGNKAFKDRVVDFYTDLIDYHLVQPHQQLLRAVSSDGLGPESAADSSPSRTKESSDAPSTTTTTGSATVSQKGPRPPKVPKMRQINVLLITHGGWIQRLMEHVLEDLNFQMDCDLLNGFPKNTAVYRFEINKVFKPDEDYEWEGRIKLMNCVAHLAGMAKRETPTPSPALSRTQSPAQSPVMLRRSKLNASNASGLAANKKAFGHIYKPTGYIPGGGLAPAERTKSLGW